MGWIAAQSDGWITYPRPLAVQSEAITRWRKVTADATQGRFKPFAQSLYIDLADDPNTAASPIHLGFRLGQTVLIDFLRQLEARGVNHVILNLKYGQRPAAEVLEELGADVVPLFPKLDQAGHTVGATEAGPSPSPWWLGEPGDELGEPPPVFSVPLYDTLRSIMGVS
jgi:hypothetical protein